MSYFQEELQIHSYICSRWRIFFESGQDLNPQPELYRPKELSLIASKAYCGIFQHRSKVGKWNTWPELPRSCQLHHCSRWQIFFESGQDLNPQSHASQASNIHIHLKELSSIASNVHTCTYNVVSFGLGHWPYTDQCTLLHIYYVIVLQ